METKTIDTKVVELIMDANKAYLACGQNNHVYLQEAVKAPFGKVEYTDVIDLTEFGLNINDMPAELAPYKIMSCYPKTGRLCGHCSLNGR